MNRQSIQVQADSEGKALHNFWNHIHFHPTDAIEDGWGRRILDQVSEDRAARYEAGEGSVGRSEAVDRGDRKKERLWVGEYFL